MPNRADCGHVVVSARALAMLASPAVLRRLRVAYRADPVYDELLTVSAAVLGYADVTKVAIGAAEADAWIMTDEAARRLGVKPAAVRRMLREGRLRGVKRGTVWLIDPAALTWRELAC